MDLVPTACARSGFDGRGRDGRIAADGSVRQGGTGRIAEDREGGNEQCRDVQAHEHGPVQVLLSCSPISVTAAADWAFRLTIPILASTVSSLKERSRVKT